MAYKFKPNKSVAKRFKVTATGKLKRRHTLSTHLRSARDAKKNQHVSEVKEVRIRPRTDDHDLQVRVRAARRFLEEGHKVKVEVRFRGREATHPEVARDQIGRIAAGVDS